jgi:hypothetical protein
MSVTISIEVEGNKKYYPGTAIVRINGEIHAKLRTGESYEITIPDPSFSTQRKKFKDAYSCDSGSSWYAA